MPVSVTQADIEKVWRPLTTEESSIVPGLSDSAWIRIVAAVPALADTPLPVTEATVRDVIVSMIVRVFKNPDSARIISESIDDHILAKTLDTAISSGELYVSAHEIALLTPHVVPVYGMYVVGLGGV